MTECACIIVTSEATRSVLLHTRDPHIEWLAHCNSVQKHVLNSAEVSILLSGEGLAGVGSSLLLLQ